MGLLSEAAVLQGSLVLDGASDWGSGERRLGGWSSALDPARKPLVGHLLVDSNKLNFPKTH